MGNLETNCKCDGKFQYLSVNWNFLCNIVLQFLEEGGKQIWIGDGVCDDINNNGHCDFDGGDCCGCGGSFKKQYCFDCICKGN